MGRNAMLLARRDVGLNVQLRVGASKVFENGWLLVDMRNRVFCAYIVGDYQFFPDDINVVPEMAVVICVFEPFRGLEVAYGSVVCVVDL